MKTEPENITATDGISGDASIAPQPNVSDSNDTEGVDLDAVYGFPVANYILLHDARLSAEILESRKPTRLPLTPRWFAGMIAVRGKFVPVFDLSLLLRGEERTTFRNLSRRIVVIGTADDAAGLFLDGLPTRISPQRLNSSVETELPELLNQLARQVFESEGEVWVDVDFPTLFTLLGRATIDEEGALNHEASGHVDVLMSPTRAEERDEMNVSVGSVANG